jgi:CLIP-associating protein 1/2
MAPRPATAGPYSGRNHDGPVSERSSPRDVKAKTVTPKVISGSPKRTVPRPRPGHNPTLSESSVPTPSKVVSGKPAASPRTSPSKGRAAAGTLQPSSAAAISEEPTLVMPTIANLQEAQVDSPKSLKNDGAAAEHPELVVTGTPTKPLKVYEDPFTDDQATPRPMIVAEDSERPALEDKPVNEDAVSLSMARADPDTPVDDMSPEKTRQNSRILESGITRVKAQSLDVHGFRKLQSLIRDNKSLFTDDKFDTLIVGLFEYLESPLSSLAPEKVQDVKAQVLATIKLLLKKARDNFQPHVSQGLDALLTARAAYQARTHIVSGLELLADELVTIGDADEITVTMTKRLSGMDTDTTGCRSLSMGLHVMKQLIDTKASFSPSESEIAGLSALASRCIESKESGVRMDAVQLCVALHQRIGEQKFWESMKDIKEDPKNLITYYIAKRKREDTPA